MQHSWSASFLNIGVKYYSVFCIVHIKFHLHSKFNFMKWSIVISLSLIFWLPQILNYWKLEPLFFFSGKFRFIFVLSIRLQKKTTLHHSFELNLKWIPKQKCHLKTWTRDTAIAGKFLANNISKALCRWGIIPQSAWKHVKTRYRQQPSESRQLKLSRVTDDKLLDELYGMELYVVFWRLSWRLHQRAKTCSHTK